MSIWGATILAYLLIGIVFSEFAAFGHRRKHDLPLYWGMWVAGIIGWPIILYVGGRRKK